MGVFLKSSLVIALFCFLLLPGKYLSAQPELRTEFARQGQEIKEIQQKLRSLEGSSEAVDYVNRQNERVYKDLDLRVQALESKLDSLLSLLKDQQAAPSEASVEAYEEYQGLLNLMEAQDYQNAASGFLGFQKKHPSSEWAKPASFWAGEAFYFLGDYPRAIKEYQNFLKAAPEHPRRAEALYGQGKSFMALKKNSEAQLFFKKVMANYPNSDAAIRAQAKLNQLSEENSGQAVKKTPTKPKAKTSVEFEAKPRPLHKASPMPRSPASSAPLF